MQKLTKAFSVNSIDPVLIDVPMPIIAPRLLLRPSKAGDGQQLAEIKCESWPELSRWMDFADGKPVESISEQEDEIYVRKKHSDFILRKDELWLLAFENSSNRLVGTDGYHAIDWKGGVLAAGYWMRTSETGKGYATEITNALIRYAFNALSANRLSISHAEGNLASQRIVQKLGFEKEGTTRKSYLLQGQLTDAHHYARFDDSNLPPLEVTWG